MLLFTWDAAKEESNRRNHGVSFDGLLHLSRQGRVEGGEERWQTPRRGGLLVAHTRRETGGDEHIRIISARRATKQESNIYEEGA